MISIRTLVLGSVAITSSGVQAADLPVAKAAPVEYVRICSTHGAGFFYVPGTETCLRVGGHVRAEYLYLEPSDRAQDTIGFLARGRINLDARTATPYGLLRTYIRMEMTWTTGAYGFSSTSPEISQAFVQFGGLTAGRAVSFFSSPDLPAPNFGDLRFDDPANAEVNLFAYTFSFGNGFSATLSFEDGTERRVNNELDSPVRGGQRDSSLCSHPVHLWRRAHTGCRGQYLLHWHVGWCAVLRCPASDPRRGGWSHHG
jgi:hypothetical protein